jgi:hypothetical protein
LFASVSLAALLIRVEKAVLAFGKLLSPAKMFSDLLFLLVATSVLFPNSFHFLAFPGLPIVFLFSLQLNSVY